VLICVFRCCSKGGESYLLSGVNCRWGGKAFKDCGGASNATAGQSWGGNTNVKGSSAVGPKLTVLFETVYSGKPFCFVSFGGSDTTNHYSLDAHADRVEVYLKKKGCCAMDWAEFNENVAMVCHGATAA
jgi:hypothetical protein